MTSEINWAAIENFIGYGRSNAPVVFVGMEEGVATDGADRDLRRRSMYPPIHRIEPTATFQPTWNVMSYVMLHLAREDNTREARRAYQIASLGQPGGDALLTELLPYPHRRIDAWDEVFHSRYSTRAAYEAAMIPQRIVQLREFIWSAPRKAVIAYGKAHWPHFMQLAPSTTEWTDIGIFRVAEAGPTRIVLSPHFTARAFAGHRDTLASLAAGQPQ